MVDLFFYSAKFLGIRRASQAQPRKAECLWLYSHVLYGDTEPLRLLPNGSEPSHCVQQAHALGGLWHHCRPPPLQLLRPSLIRLTF